MTAATRSLGLGAVIALMIALLPFTRFVFSYFGVLFHELGHALVGTVFGYPSLPAFDLTYGGGVTLHQDRVPILAGLVLVALIAVRRRYHEYRHLAQLLAAVIVGYAIVAATSLHEIAILAAGHLTELTLAGVFLYRAWSGAAVRIAAERPLYAAVGWFVVASNARFTWLLSTSAEDRAMYGEAKGGGHWMDLSQIAGEHLGTSLQAVAALFLLLTLATPVLAGWVYMRREAIAEWLAD